MLIDTVVLPWYSKQFCAQQFLGGSAAPDGFLQRAIKAAFWWTDRKVSVSYACGGVSGGVLSADETDARAHTLTDSAPRAHTKFVVTRSNNNYKCNGPDHWVYVVI